MKLALPQGSVGTATGDPRSGVEGGQGVNVCILPVYAVIWQL